MNPSITLQIPLEMNRGPKTYNPERKATKQKMTYSQDLRKGRKEKEMLQG